MKSGLACFNIRQLNHIYLNFILSIRESRLVLFAFVCEYDMMRLIVLINFVRMNDMLSCGIVTSMFECSFFVR